MSSTRILYIITYASILKQNKQGQSILIFVSNRFSGFIAEILLSNYSRDFNI